MALLKHKSSTLKIALNERKEKEITFKDIRSSKRYHGALRCCPPLKRKVFLKRKEQRKGKETERKKRREEINTLKDIRSSKDIMEPFVVAFPSKRKPFSFKDCLKRKRNKVKGRKGKKEE